MLLFQSFDSWILTIFLLLVSSCAITSRLPTSNGSPSTLSSSSRTESDGAARRIVMDAQTLRIVGSFGERPLVVEPPNPPPVAEVARKHKTEALPEGQATKKKKGKGRPRYPLSADPTYVWLNGEVDNFVSRCTSSYLLECIRSYDIYAPEFVPYISLCGCTR